MKTFIEEHLENWRAYEKVRSEGKLKMWAPQAERATGLSKDDYMFVIKNFHALKKAVEAAKHKNWNSL